MSLMKCEECGGQVSTDAKACPHCGAKVPKPPGLGTMVFAAMVVLMMVKCTYDNAAAPPPPVKTAAQIEAEQRKEREFQLDVALVRSLKQSMKNPASFELVEAFRAGTEVLCVTYRGTNGFGAVTTERTGIERRSTKMLPWQKWCAGAGGEDMTYIRRAL